MRRGAWWGGWLSAVWGVNQRRASEGSHKARAVRIATSNSEVEVIKCGFNVDVSRLKKSGDVYALVPPITRANNLLLGMTWVDTFGDLLVVNLTKGNYAALHFHQCGWFGGGRHKVAGTVYSADGEPKLAVCGKWNEQMSYMCVRHHLPCHPVSFVARDTRDASCIHKSHASRCTTGSTHVTLQWESRGGSLSAAEGGRVGSAQGVRCGGGGG